MNFQEISEEALKIHVNNECPNEEKGIPGFWMKAISNCFIYMDILNENDKEILFYLKDIRVVYLEKNVNLIKDRTSQSTSISIKINILIMKF